MFLTELSVQNFRCFDDEGIKISFNAGLTALVGENDSGKTAIIDAIRYALGTTDQEWTKIEDSDFYREDSSLEIKITCKFTSLSLQEKSAYLEYLSYEDENETKKEVLYINWTANKNILAGKNGRSFIKIETCSGKNADGPSLVLEVKELLRATYLRPLRDAANAMSAGRNSRLSQVLNNMPNIQSGDNFNSSEPEKNDISKLSIQGLSEFFDYALDKHAGIKEAQSKVKNELDQKLLLTQDKYEPSIHVVSSPNPAQRLKIILEKLSLEIKRGDNASGNLGLGTDNLLYMACELLLLGSEKSEPCATLLLIEEPEAHLHPQRQLKIMKSLQQEAENKNIQVILTTHSPLLASVIKLENMVLVQNGKAFSLKKEETKLAVSDYRFLERFLDSTKANLFFAKGVVIVEGDAENIVLPTIARLLGKDFADYGVSIVNVGGTGLSRYSKIFQRKDKVKEINIPVACMTDLDLRPDDALEICFDIIEKDSSKWPAKRKWKAHSEVENIEEFRARICQKCTGQKVKTFVADKWTFEYDLAYSGLAEEVYLAAQLAIKDESNVPAGKSCKEIYKDSMEDFSRDISSKDIDIKAAIVYSEFTKCTKASKAIAAQYLAAILERRYTNNRIALHDKLPQYVKDTIEYVTDKFDLSESREDGVSQK